MISNTFTLMVVAMAGIFFVVLSFILLQAKTQNKILVQKKMITERELLHQKELARILIVSQENERRRIGMDLHDQVGTALSTLRMHLEKTATAGPAQLPELNVVSKKHIDAIIHNTRKISHNLSPFIKSAYELRDGLEDLAEQVTGSAALTVQVAFNDIEKFNFLLEDTQLALYRILSELVNNTIKHAAATVAQISFLKKDALLTVHYQDDGIGMLSTDSNKKGIGMANIESRCNAMSATYAITTGKGEGFDMEIKIPITG